MVRRGWCLGLILDFAAKRMVSRSSDDHTSTEHRQAPRQALPKLRRIVPLPTIRNSFLLRLDGFGIFALRLYPRTWLESRPRSVTGWVRDSRDGWAIAVQLWV